MIFDNYYLYRLIFKIFLENINLLFRFGYSRNLFITNKKRTENSIRFIIYLYTVLPTILKGYTH